MLTLTARIDAAPRVHGTLALPWSHRARMERRATLACGEPVALALPRGPALRHGDLLRGDDGRVVRVAAAPEPTYAVRSSDPRLLAQCARLLGRRGARVQLCGWGLRVCAAPPLAALLRALGASVDEELAAFEPDAGELY